MAPTLAPGEPDRLLRLLRSRSRGLGSPGALGNRLLPGVTIYHHPDLLRNLGGLLSFWPKNMMKHLLLELY